MKEVIYEVCHGPDRSHDQIECQIYDRLREAREAIKELPFGRFWKLVRISGGRKYTQQAVKVIDKGGPDIEQQKERDRFRAQYLRKD